MRPTGQIIGVYDPLLLEEIAQALSQLRCQQAIALHGREGLDEAGLADVTDLAVLQDQKVRCLTLNPQHCKLVKPFMANMAMAAIAAGTDALMIEVHPNPAKALSDGPQSLTPEKFDRLVQEMSLLGKLGDR